MTLHIVCFDQVPAQAWRNGGGITRELLAWAPAGEPSWQLRISVADITQDGPFSAFVGVARWFAVIEGAGVALHFAGGTRQQTAADPPLAFDGAAAPGCTLLQGPTRDLNLMLRGVGGGMQRASAGSPWVHPAAWRGVFTARGARLAVEGQGALDVPAMALAWMATQVPQRAAWRLHPLDDEPLRAWWLWAQSPPE